MATDANILLGYRPAKTTSPAEMYEAGQRIEQNRLSGLMNQMKMDEYKSGVERSNSLRGILSNNAPDTVGRLRQGGFLKESMDLAKSDSDIAGSAATTRKNELEAAAKRLDLAGQAFGYVRANPTVENANAALDYLAQNGVFTPEQVAQHKQKITAEPQRVGEMADLAYRAALGAKDQLFKTETRNTGGTTDTLAIDPVTGKAQVTNSVRNTQSPDSVATNARIASDNKASRDQSAYQFDQRQQADAVKQKTGGTGRTGPMSVTLQKELLESDDTVQSSQNVVRTLEAAKRKNKDAYSGYFAKGRAVLASNTPFSSESADATIDIDNMMTGQGLEQMKSIFGAAPTEGERKILMDMQASVDKTPKQREAIMDRAIAAAQRREQYAKAKAGSIRDGSYLTQGAPVVADTAPAAQSPQDQQAMQWAKSNPNDPRAAAILQRLGGK